MHDEPNAASRLSDQAPASRRAGVERTPMNRQRFREPRRRRLSSLSFGWPHTQRIHWSRALRLFALWSAIYVCPSGRLRRNCRKLARSCAPIARLIAWRLPPRYFSSRSSNPLAARVAACRLMSSYSAQREHNRALFNRELSGATVYDGHGRLSSRSNKHCDEAGDNKRDSPGEIKIKPGSLQDAHPQLFVHNHRNETRHDEESESMDNNRDSCEPRVG